MSTHLDTNILIDIFTQDSDWFEWSLASMRDLAERGLVMTSVVYAEASTRFADRAGFDARLSVLSVQLAQPSRQALFVAAKAHAVYRRRGGARSTTLPDFFIGAHAMVAGVPLLTRDPARFRTYFPNLELIAP